MYEQVQVKLDAVRPYLQREGGDVDLVEIDDNGVVYLRLMGACENCPSSTITLKVIIERELNEIPGFLKIEQVY